MNGSVCDGANLKNKLMGVMFFFFYCREKKQVCHAPIAHKYFVLKIYNPILTLIRAAGGVHDFRNFEEVYLCNGLSSNLQNSWVPQKTSREYILLNTLDRKTAFFASYRPKRARNCSFFAVFGYFVRLWRYIWLLWNSPPPPQGRALPPPIVGAPSSSGAAHMVSSSF
jgi:hypothetical protein